MKLHLGFQLKDEYVDNDFRMSIVSFLKKILSSTYEEEYQRLYDEKSIKDFTFSTYFPQGRISKNYIYSPEKSMNIAFSGVRDDLVVKVYNATLSHKYYSHPMPNNQAMTLKKVHLSNPNEILGEKVTIKFLSPLIVRKHNRDKDLYLSYEDDSFLEYLNHNTLSLLQALGAKNQLKIKSIKPIRARKTVVKNDGLLYQASIGTFLLHADNQLINILYKAGLGSRRGLGFGMFEVIGGIYE